MGTVTSQCTVTTMSTPPGTQRHLVRLMELVAADARVTPRILEMPSTCLADPTGDRDMIAVDLGLWHSGTVPVDAAAAFDRAQRWWASCGLHVTCHRHLDGSDELIGVTDDGGHVRLRLAPWGMSFTGMTAPTRGHRSWVYGLSGRTTDIPDDRAAAAAADRATWRQRWWTRNPAGSVAAAAHN